MVNMCDDQHCFITEQKHALDVVLQGNALPDATAFQGACLSVTQTSDQDGSTSPLDDDGGDAAAGRVMVSVRTKQGIPGLLSKLDALVADVLRSKFGN